MVESFEVKSVVRGYNIYKDVWSASVEQCYLKLVNKKASFFERTIWPIVNLGTMSNSWKYFIFRCEFSYPWLLIFAENFLYVPCVTLPFCIMVYTTGFISSLIASVCEDSMVSVKYLLELAIGKTASLLPRLLSSFTCMSTLKYLNTANLLMPKVNISRVKFSWITID